MKQKTPLFTETNDQIYSWNQKGRKLAVTERILSFLIMPALWLVLVSLMIFREIQLDALKFSGLLMVMVSILIVLIGFLFFIHNLFERISVKGSSEERHDYLLYLYLHGYGRYENLRNRMLLMMAQMDLETGRRERAEKELQEIHTEKLSGRDVKICDLFQIALTYEKDPDEVRSWYVRYAGVSDEKNEFPANEIVKGWLDQKVSLKEITEVLSGVSIEKRQSLFLTLLFCILTGHCLFFVALKYFAGPAWRMRIGYEKISGYLTSLFLLILGSWILGLMIHRRKRNRTTGSKIRFVIAIVCWILLFCILSGWFFAMVAFDTDGTETILKKNVHDLETHVTYAYLKTEDEYDTGYYRSPDFMIMEEWEEAMLYDTRLPSKEEDDDTPESTVTPSATPDTSDPDTASDDGFVSQNAMQRVYEYLKDQNTYGDLSITFHANAKGDLYALITKGKESDGTAYELRLYDNGVKDSQNEIVLEKVYPGGTPDTQLLDFYLVDGKGNVTDEQKTTW